MRKTLISTAIAAAALFGLSATAHAGTIVVQINPDGIPGGDPVINVGSLDWAVGNSIAVAQPGQNVNAPFVGQVYDVFAHAALNAFQNSGGSGIGGLQLNAGYEWTFVSHFKEQLDSVVGPFTSQSVINDPSNVFDVYVSPVNSNNLTGGGFSDGTLVMEAKGGVGTGAFTATVGPTGALVTGPLDNFITNDYPGYTTEFGQGSTTIVGTVTYLNAAFFPTLSVGSNVNLFFTTQQALNYNQTNPSSCFFDPVTAAYFKGAGNGIAGAPCVSAAGDGGTIGLSGNGIPGSPGPNQMFQTDASTSFTSTAPEPGSLALIGGALLGFFGVSRRRKVK